MYINSLIKKIVKTVFILSIIFLANDKVIAQELNTSQLDSLYSKFIQLRAPELLPETDEPVELSIEDRKCGFTLVNDVKLNLNSFTIEQQNILKTLLARPSLQTSVVSPSGFFRIHYDPSGTNRPNYSTGLTIDENVAEVARALDSVYRFEVEQLLFLAPPPDGDGGGDNKYDVYIQNQSSSIYGYTEWESKVGSVNWTSFMVIDNDYTGYYSAGLNGMKVTVAHEFHHGIQLGNYSVFNGTSPYRDSDIFFYELTSTSMEEFVYDDVNDYYAYMNSYFNNTDLAFPRQNGYNLAIWNIYLTNNFGFGILKRQWELIPSIKAILAINQSLNEVGTSYPRELNKFGIWTFFTNFRSIPGKYFEEAVNYPEVTSTFTIQYPAPPPDLMSAPTANNYVKFNIASNSDTLVAIVTNADAIAASENSNQYFDFNYTLFNNPTSGQRELTGDYSSTFSVSNTNYWAVSEVLNNQLIREDSLIVPPASNVEYAYPNPFNYSTSLLNTPLVFFPFEENVGETVDFNIYSVDMQLIYIKEVSIQILPGGQTGVSWDGIDDNNNKLASGVYIYVIKAGDEVVKGKFVIFNE
ncbi:MAG: hypothetical protein IPM14_08855 [bacterium]|nr:hypothetical protein [bacterium]